MMNKLFLVLLIALGIQSVSIAQKVSINESEASVSFLFIDDDVDGTLSNFKFTGDLNFDNLEASTLSGTVAAKTIDTDNWLRNRHLRRKYFKAEDFPLLKFKSSSIEKIGDSYKVMGTFTIKGISKKVVFTFQNKNNKFIGKTSLNASDFGININKEYSQNKVSITILLPYSTN